MEKRCDRAGIAYVPDYVVNAGGMMGASTVIFTEPSREKSIKQIDGLQGAIKEILIRAKHENRSSSQAQSTQQPALHQCCATPAVLEQP